MRFKCDGGWHIVNRTSHIYTSLDYAIGFMMFSFYVAISLNHSIPSAEYS